MENIEEDRDLLSHSNSPGIVNLVPSERNEEPYLVSHREDLLVDELIHILHDAATRVLQPCNINIREVMHLTLDQDREERLRFL